MKKKTVYLRCGEANAYEYVGENEEKKQKKGSCGVKSRWRDDLYSFLKEDSHSQDWTKSFRYFSMQDSEESKQCLNFQ